MLGYRPCLPVHKMSLLNRNHVLSQDRKALALLAPSELFNAYHLAVRFQPCFVFRARDRRQVKFEPDLDSLRRARTGKNKCPSLANVTGSAFTSLYYAAVRPPERNWRFQGKPNGFSRVSWPSHQSPRPTPFEWTVHAKVSADSPQEVRCHLIGRHLFQSTLTETGYLADETKVRNALKQMSLARAGHLAPGPPTKLRSMRG